MGTERIVDKGFPFAIEYDNERNEVYFLHNYLIDGKREKRVKATETDWLLFNLLCETKRTSTPEKRTLWQRITGK